MNSSLILKAEDIHLWFAFPDEIQDRNLLLQYQELMNHEEKERHRRFHFEKDRHRFLITRAMVRSALSRYADVLPHQWGFSANAYGRPEIIPFGEISLPPLRFNISHTAGLIVCAIMLRQDIGVDVEDTQRRTEGAGIAKRFFSSREVNDLHSLRENEKREYFFRYWTLKESYIKARGMGLSIPLGQFSFHIVKNRRIDIRFSPETDDNPENWQFWLFCPTPRHRMAVAVRREAGRGYRISMKKMIPLEQEEDFCASLLQASDVL